MTRFFFSPPFHAYIKFTIVCVCVCVHHARRMIVSTYTADAMRIGIYRLLLIIKVSVYRSIRIYATIRCNMFCLQRTREIKKKKKKFRIRLRVYLGTKMTLNRYHYKCFPVVFSSYNL